MKQISVKKLRPGFKVAQPIYSGKDGRLLLNADTVLTEKHIERLGQLSVFTVCINDELPPEQYQNATKQEEFEQTRLKAINQTKLVFSEFGSRNSKNNLMSRAIIKTKQTVGIIIGIVDKLLKDRKLLTNLVTMRSFDNCTFKHSVNVCILSMLTGISIGFNKSKLFFLGMAALLHDIGKIYVSEDILKKPGKLTSEEFDIIKEHANFGYQILKDSGLSRVCAVTALQHHERYDGSGYPNDLKSSEINEFARIVGVADVYEALTADRVYRKAYSACEAYEMIAGSGNSLFDFNIVQSFLQNIAIYPVGTIVRLNTGETGIVIETASPLFPKIRILFSLKNRANKEIQLDKHSNLFISNVARN